MKKIIAIVLLCLFTTVGSVAGTNLTCTVTNVITPILPEGYGSVVIECKKLKDIKVGDKIKVKVEPVKDSLEGC